MTDRPTPATAVSPARTLASNRASLSQFPAVRLRRRRSSDWMRRLVQENHLQVSDLIWPIFVQEENGRTPVPSLPGVDRIGPDLWVEVASQAQALGIPAIALFPVVPAHRKTHACEEAWRADNLVCQAMRSIRAGVNGLGLIADVALDPYNATGQDGLLSESGEVLNDETLEALIKQSLAQADAGAHILAPSDMMDGRIAVIRAALDEAGHSSVALMSYAAKFASAFYGPFRDAVGSSGALLGDKKTYQLNPANVREAELEAQYDIEEGADMLIVKPGLPYLDILQRISATSPIPVYAYQVSGEYAMLKAAAAQGWLDEQATVSETLMAFKRAGADGIWSYAALDLARSMKG